MSEQEIAQKAAEIAAKANECCYRSDGYEEELQAMITTAIQEAVAQARREALEEAQKRCMELAAGFSIEGMHKQHLGASDCAYSIGALAAQPAQGNETK